MKHIIETALLGKRFRRTAGYRDLLLSPFRREEITAVQGASIQVKEGELFGLLGPNGAGKTTLIKLLCTLILPSEGTARVGGYDVVTETAQAKELVGLVNCDERSFFWRLTGRQNLEFFAALYDVRPGEAQQRIAELLLLVELTEHADQRFNGYSTGMRQRLAIARGLLRMPLVLFMDEPTRSLDPINAKSLRAFIREQLVDTLGRTVVLVTHRLEEAEELCDRVAVMNEGRIVACGSVAELKNAKWADRVYELEVQDLAPDAVDGLNAVRGVVSSTTLSAHSTSSRLRLVLDNEERALSRVLSAILAGGGDILSCRLCELSLEEAFVDLIEEDAVRAP